jgi:hypothetical protein
MTPQERRLVPRKECALPVRFRIRDNGLENQPKEPHPHSKGGASSAAHNGMCEGVALNLSERGIHFKSRERLTVGQPLEVYFTLPPELTGRKTEDVRCNARVVHVEARPDKNGLTMVGAAVERFETLAASRNWGN